jgi:predicted dehydrogenase
MRPLRFGLAGTGYWARIAHAAALASTEGVEFAAVWGRDQAAAGKLAGSHGATAYQDFDEFIAAVDAVAFAVPPQVQAALAQRAARAGKHLLLEKPIAASVADANALARAVDDAGVATVVFFTALFQPDLRAWLADAAARGGWLGGTAVWLGTALQPGNPFNTPWRRQKGGLWDLAPHLIALLLTSLGPAEVAAASRGPADVSHLVLRHLGGASSALTVTLSAPPAAEYLEVFLWGATGRSAAPREGGDAVTPLRVALGELAGNVSSGQRRHRCDVHFGRDVVALVADAERLMSGG